MWPAMEMRAIIAMSISSLFPYAYACVCVYVRMCIYVYVYGFLDDPDVKNLLAIYKTQVWSLDREDPLEGNGNPPQYSYLENPMDKGAWRATVHGVTKSQTWWATHTLKSQWLTTAQICFSLPLSCPVWIDVGILLILITQGWDEKEVHLDTGFLDDPQNYVGQQKLSCTSW